MMVYLAQITIVPTPTPIPVEVVEKAVQVIDAFQSLGPIMAVLGLAALALVVVLLNAWSNRNSNASVVTTLVNAALQKDKDIADLKEQRQQEHEQHIEAMNRLDAQGARTNDLSQEANGILRAFNERGSERDGVQRQLAEDIHAIVSTGSLPVQEILQRVRGITDILALVDTRTADWTAVLSVITPLIVELGALKAEAKKHSTQPIPFVNHPNESEIKP